MSSAQAKLRSAATMAVLAVLLLAGGGLGLVGGDRAVPGARTTRPPAARTRVAEGEKVYPDQVTVSVLNAGTREGLADRTMSDLVDAGLDKGELGNAPDDTKVSGVEIWAEDLKNPAVKLVESFLGQGRRSWSAASAPLPGVNVVVGEEFPGVVRGSGVGRRQGGRRPSAARRPRTCRRLLVEPLGEAAPLADLRAAAARSAPAACVG